jgi:hypothetical protein
MALSFLGREICRPTKPKCSNWIINSNWTFIINKTRRKSHYYKFHWCWFWRYLNLQLYKKPV